MKFIFKSVSIIAACCTVFAVSSSQGSQVSGVRGNILDQSHEPIPGCTLYLVSEQYRTRPEVTQADGAFNIPVPLQLTSNTAGSAVYIEVYWNTELLFRQSIDLSVKNAQQSTEEQILQLQPILLSLAGSPSPTPYKDSFISLSKDWGTPNRFWSIQDGKLIIRADPESGTLVFNKSRKFADADISVEVSPSHSTGQWYPGGLAFWASSDDDCFIFYIRDDGAFSISRWRFNGWQRLVNWQKSSAIKTGVGEVNALRVVTRGTEVAAYINNSVVADIDVEAPQGGGYVGLFGQSSQNTRNYWQFWDLKINPLTGKY